ncbi:RSN1 [Cyberlindnera jadinii]|uniref:RSN1 protein n=1 Tax=Cyberlindnera jadinii (strain ATCC 18201 / CBS 1600 / BCRC 20928 / JCM 3617 / NBRC 0987 / NRRL Y-1542) TaxID=983966 RepID=A0A0H5C027_CYBJN|nr:RSN1 [Cyberlindnera jadinii]
MASSSSNTANTSTQAVLTAFISNGVVFGVFVGLFLLLRLKFLRIYQPKSSFDLINEEKKPEPLPSGLWQWLLPLVKKSDNFVIRQAGLDGYFFIRYCFNVAAICFVYTLLLFPILLPVNGVNGKGNDGLDRYTFANVRIRGRYYAHAILAWVVYLGIIYVIYRELTYYASMRQAVLSSPRYGKKLSSRTVLFQTVPDQYLDENEFRKLFDDVRNVWIARASSKIEKKVEERDKLAYRLEAAEVKLLKMAMKAKLKKEKKGEPVPTDINELVPTKKRPSHRLKFLIGKKVDTIEYAKENLPILNKEVQELQANHDNDKPMNSVFVEFGSQYTAQMAYQSVAHHTALHMSPRYIGLEPSDIVWLNMRLFWWERLVRKTGSVAAIVALLIFWSIPVAFVGLISNVTYLTNKLHGLNFIYNLPPALLGLITSMLPTIMLLALMSLLPIFIRSMAKASGVPSTQMVEYFTQQSYFAFQVIQVFLVTTIASSATSTVTQIVEEPSSAMYLLSENLPKSSNFYLSYILLQGLSVSSGALLQIGTLITFYLFGLLDGTPRKKWTRFTKLSSCSWGTTFPVFTNLTVITFAYAIISPFILLFASVGFFLIYLAYLYNLTYTFQESPDARGIHYPRAMFQTLVGVYLGEVCLLGLFAVSKAWGPLVIVAILLGFTTFLHTNLNEAFDHLLTVVPVDTMKPLDGVSDTPSYRHHNDSWAPRDSGLYDKSLLSSVRHDSSFLSPPVNAFEMGDLSRLSVEYARHGSSVPLLADGDEKLIPPAPFWKRFLLPHIYASYKVSKTRLPDIYQFKDPSEETDAVKLQHAYDYPAVSAKCPILWIPRDPLGLSTIEIEKLKGVVDIRDEHSEFNEKGKVVWTGPPPSYEESNSSVEELNSDKAQNESN